MISGVCVYICVCICACVFVCMYEHVYVCTLCLCVYVYVCTYEHEPVLSKNMHTHQGMHVEVREPPHTWSYLV